MIAGFIKALMTVMVVVYARAGAALPSVRVRCTEREMVVSVRAQALGSGASVRAEELRLGNGNPERCGSAMRRETELELRAELHECGSTLRVEGDSVVYENVLFYSPALNPFGITRSTAARIPVQCRYQRTHFVSTNQELKPADQPGSAPLRFSLQLMSDDWVSERFSTVFRLDDVLNLRASMLNAEHSPLKLYVDSCVLTQEPDTEHAPSCPLIHNHGCSVDHRSGGPTVCFLPRMKDHELQLQMDAHQLYRYSQNTIYVTCLLKAAEDQSSVNKVCGYTGDGWLSVDGDHAVCQCCDSVCEDRRPSRVFEGSAAAESCAVVTVGPVIILQKTVPLIH
ncbi:zona pellucida sperm-binding protein 3-like [Pygocentrus nattereri]|uniref:Zona pellucida sperm-binding protein 3 n=1 Tax=Pygocentrus nattereri TaxID=42514 RepID=A0A3B4C6B4_PYGNA|nr:zona pellucida sperm-binding protein 3-like [Pygocentrus nattereri]